MMSEEFNSTNNDETQSPVEQAAQPTETTVNESVETPATNELCIGMYDNITKWF